MRNEIKISSAFLLAALLGACGQSGPLYMPGQATGIHKKDEFIFGGDPSKTQKSPTATAKEQSTNPLKAVNTPTNTSTETGANADTNQTVNSIPLTNEDANSTK